MKTEKIDVLIFLCGVGLGISLGLELMFILFEYSRFCL